MEKELIHFKNKDLIAQDHEKVLCRQNKDYKRENQKKKLKKISLIKKL